MYREGYIEKEGVMGGAWLQTLVYKRRVGADDSMSQKVETEAERVAREWQCGEIEAISCSLRDLNMLIDRTLGEEGGNSVSGTMKRCANYFWTQSGESVIEYRRKTMTTEEVSK